MIKISIDNSAAEAAEDVLKKIKNNLELLENDFERMLFNITSLSILFDELIKDENVTVDELKKIKYETIFDRIELAKRVNRQDIVEVCQYMVENISNSNIDKYHGEDICLDVRNSEKIS